MFRNLGEFFGNWKFFGNSLEILSEFFWNSFGILNCTLTQNCECDMKWCKFWLKERQDRTRNQILRSALERSRLKIQSSMQRCRIYQFPPTPSYVTGLDIAISVSWCLFLCLLRLPHTMSCLNYDCVISRASNKPLSWELFLFTKVKCIKVTGQYSKKGLPNALVFELFLTPKL